MDAARVSMADAVVAEVRRQIREGRLVPGQTYSVYRLADELGFSRSPVREGLLKLAEAGLVRFQRNRGFQVWLPSTSDIAEIFAVRLALEVPAARRAALRADEAQRTEIETCMVALEAEVASGDEARFWELDRELHRVILAGGGNRRVVSVVDGLRQTVSLLGEPTERSKDEICGEHRPIVDAIGARDEARAAASMAEHLSATALSLMARAGATDVSDPALRELWRSFAR